MTAPAWLTARPIAHRGLHDAAAGRVENTIAAALAAAERGFAVEVDLRRTADGEVVVFHDETLDRLTAGSGEVRQMRLAELRAVQFRIGGNAIPTLAELLAAVAGRVPLFLELKPDRRDPGLLEQRVAELLRGYAGEAALMSFAARSIARLGATLGRPLGLVAGSAPSAMLELARWRLAGRRSPPDFLAFNAERLPARSAIAFRRAGRPVLTWTVRSPAAADQARRHADQIIFEGFDPDAA